MCSIGAAATGDGSRTLLAFHPLLALQSQLPREVVIVQALQPLVLSCELEVVLPLASLTRKQRLSLPRRTQFFICLVSSSSNGLDRGNSWTCYPL